MKWLFVFLLLLLPTVFAATEYGTELTEEEKEKFNEIIEPLRRIYKLGVYLSFTVASLCAIYAAYLFMTSGNNPANKEKAKKWAVSIVIGMMIILAIPFLINFVF